MAAFAAACLPPDLTVHDDDASTIANVRAAVVQLLSEIKIIAGEVNDARHWAATHENEARLEYQKRVADARRTGGDISLRPSSEGWEHLREALEFAHRAERWAARAVYMADSLRMIISRTLLGITLSDADRQWYKEALVSSETDAAQLVREARDAHSRVNQTFRQSTGEAPPAVAASTSVASAGAAAAESGVPADAFLDDSELKLWGKKKKKTTTAAPRKKKSGKWTDRVSNLAFWRSMNSEAAPPGDLSLDSLSA